MRSASVLLLLPLSACVLVTSPEDWVAQRNAALCSLQVDCFGTFPDRAACQASQAAFDEGPCDAFRSIPAQICVEEMRLQALDCPTNDLAAWQVPASCAEVCAPLDHDTGT